MIDNIVKIGGGDIAQVAAQADFDVMVLEVEDEWFKSDTRGLDTTTNASRAIAEQYSDHLRAPKGLRALAAYEQLGRKPRRGSGNHSDEAR